MIIVFEKSFLNFCHFIQLLNLNFSRLPSFFGFKRYLLLVLKDISRALWFKRKKSVKRRYKNHSFKKKRAFYIPNLAMVIIVQYLLFQ